MLQFFGIEFRQGGLLHCRRRFTANVERGQVQAIER
jgi:hypothetical protein